MDTIYCSGCGKNKKNKDFYRSYVNPNSNVLPFCKECCVNKGLNNDGNLDIEKFKSMLMQVDRPYIHSLFVSNINKYPILKSAIGFYFKDIGMTQNRSLKYKDSIFEGDSDKKIDNDLVASQSVPSELVAKWGNNYNHKQISKLENFLKDMRNSYDVKTASHKDYLHKICKVSLKMDEALDNDNVGEFEKLSRVYDNLMKSAKFTAVQRSAVDDTGGFATFCEFIEQLEREGFIKPEPIDENFDIVEATIADMKQYTKQLVLGDGSISTLAQETIIKMKQKSEEESLSSEDLEDNSDE